MGLPTSNANTSGMLMQARRVNSVYVHVSVRSVCVCRGAHLTPPPHTHTRGSSSTSYFHGWYRREAGRGHEQGGATHLVCITAAPTKPHPQTRARRQTRQANFWIPNILTPRRNPSVPSSALFLQRHSAAPSSTATQRWATTQITDKRSETFGEVMCCIMCKQCCTCKCIKPTQILMIFA